MPITITTTNTYVDNQIKVAINELTRIQDILKKYDMDREADAMIAGGAPRDWIHGHGARDIDIFYHLEDENMSPFSNSIGVRELGGYSDYEDANGIVSVHEYSTRNHTAIQLIRTKIPVLQHIRTHFPMNMCKVWMNEDGDIGYDKSFEWGYENKIIYQVIPGWHYRYLNKILGRYRDYGFLPMNWETAEQRELGRQTAKERKQWL